jgi:hypothetical protein
MAEDEDETGRRLDAYICITGPVDQTFRSPLGRL